MKLKAYIDDSEASQEVTELFMDGYSFGDRLLEGVPFHITIVDGSLHAECVDKYDSGINWKYWEDVCQKHAQENDIFSTTAKLDDDQGFIEGILT